MQADDFISLLSFAFGKEEDDRIFLRWIPAAQHVMPLEEFKRSLYEGPKQIDEKAVIEDVMGIIGSIGRNNGNI